MIYLSEFLDELALEEDLHRIVDGAKIKIHLMMNSNVPITVDYDLVNPEKRVTMIGGVFVPPLSREARSRFFSIILEFNRDCLMHLKGAGIVPMSGRADVYTFTWFAPKEERSEEDWEGAMKVYDHLLSCATQGVKEVLEAWTRYPH